MNIQENGTHQENGADCLGGVGHVDGSIVAAHFSEVRQGSAVVQVEMAAGGGGREEEREGEKEGEEEREERKGREEEDIIVVLYAFSTQHIISFVVLTWMEIWVM